MKMKKKEGGGGANWMDTYGDMVTLLLCFFVLLYSMSSISEEKWKALVASFNPDAVPTATLTSGNEGPLADALDEDMSGMMSLEPPDEMGDEEGIGPADTVSEKEEEAAAEAAAIEELYERIKAYAEESDMSSNINVARGDGYVFVSFADAVFFGPDSYVLKPDGEAVLAAISDILSKSAEHIDEVRVMGHTAQASQDRPNYPTFDRFLSSNRATIAALYIQEHSTLEPSRIISMGFGQHRPIDTNTTTEGQAHNRRVEMIITGFDVFNTVGDSIEQYKSMREGEANLTSEPSADGEAGSD